MTGSAWGDWANYTASPLRAFENELGVQAPVGFWDPVGFTSDGDVASFKRRRSVELKHGRISMMATMGSLVAVHESWMFDHCVCANFCNVDFVFLEQACFGMSHLSNDVQSQCRLSFFESVAAAVSKDTSPQRLLASCSELRLVAAGNDFDHKDVDCLKSD